MARIRTLKPEHCLSEKIGMLSDRAYRLWVHLICYADDEGRGVLNLNEIRVRLYGYQPKISVPHLQDACQELRTRKLLYCYTENGKGYYQLHDWTDHQQISHPSPSKFPPLSPDFQSPLEDSGAFQNILPDQGSRIKDQGSGIKDQGSRNSVDFSTNKKSTGSTPQSTEAKAKSKEAANGSWEVVDGNGFDAYWHLHPGPKGPKREAMKAYREVKPPPEALEALAAQIRFKAACERRGKFFPQLQHLHRWFKKRRWEDELPEPPLSQAERLWIEAEAEEKEKSEDDRDD